MTSPLEAAFSVEMPSGLATVSLGAEIREQFPLLGPTAQPSGKRLIYLDSAATSQKPEFILAAMDRFYRTINSNVHRGVYRIACEATEATERARASIARLIGARSDRELVFAKNATEALNLVAHSWGRKNLGPEDSILLTHMEHHANIVPWQMLSAELGFEIRWIPLTEDGQLDLDDLGTLLDGTKLLSVTAMSNVLGTINPIAELARAAHAAGALICVDGCQLAPHSQVDVTASDIDFFAFSGHKMCGPTGIGALWAKSELLEAMPPFLGGGEMISDVRLDGFTANEVPWKFEAGTPPIAEIIGFGYAAEYLEAIGLSRITEHEHRLTAYALRTLTERFGDDFAAHGPAEPSLRGGVMSFGYRDLHPHDLSQILDTHDVCVRAGHHCAKPLMRLMGIGATARASWYLYNDESDIDALADALADTAAVFF